MWGVKVFHLWSRHPCNFSLGVRRYLPNLVTHPFKDKIRFVFSESTFKTVVFAFDVRSKFPRKTNWSLSHCLKDSIFYCAN